MSSAVEEVSKILEEWGRDNNTDAVVVSCLMKLADLFEAETEAFLKKDPDPFDDRHPSRLLPDCTLGHMLKTMFRNERIVDEMVKVYSQRDVFELNLASCRLLLDILPGLESVVFQEEAFVPRLFHWAEKAPNPLQSYATGLLAAAMDSPEIAASYKERNAYFVPLMIRRLHDCSQRYLRSPVSDGKPIPERPFACLGGKYDYKSFERGLDGSSINDRHKDSSIQKSGRRQKDISKSPRYSPFPPDSRNHRKLTKASPVKNSLFNEGSNSNWTELEQYVIGSYQVYPLTLSAEQRYILQYLTPMGEYQEALAPIFEEKALPLILRYIDIHQNPDVRLSFEALKYLASLLCHKKIAIEFINIGGLQLLLKVPFPSIAATGVSICLYYLAYIEEVMEKICLMPSVISELVSYALWLLECSHDSSRCHATMFFGCAFAFKIVLDSFDQQDGLRKLFNVMSTLEMFVQNSTRTLSDDQIFANRQTTRHVCGALKRYFEAHLVTEVERVNQISSTHRSDHTKTKPYKALNLSSEAVDSYCEMWRDIMSLNMNWKPVEDFIHLEAITFLLDLVASYFELSYSGRAETVKSALDVLKICSLTSVTQLLLCERLTSQEFTNVTGVLVLLQAIDEEILPVPDIQRAALHCIINCVCTKIPTDKADSSTSSKFSTTPKKKSGRSVEELLNKLWKNIRIKNGIIILLNLLSKKTPLTDADSIRALACQALCGLSRSETVKQIISKLPLVTDGLLLEYMKQPVLQDKGHEHVKFCKFGLELIARVTSAPINDGSESSMLHINKSEIVAKTKIMYNEAQLLQLISDHLSTKGFDDTVACLQKEMTEKSICLQPVPSHPLHTLISNASKTPASSHINSPSIGIRGFRSSEVFSSPSSTPVATIPPPSVPLKIVVNKKLLIPETKPNSPSRLQKQEKCSGSYVQTPAMKRQGVANYPYGDAQPSISLESIISEYLRKQHALCKNPMLACPPFDLYAPHKCPEAKNKTNAPVNCVLRIHKKMYSNVGYGGASLDRKFIYSKYRLVRTFRDEDEGRFDFACCSFLKFGDVRNQPRIIVGTLGALGNTAGRLKMFNLNTGEEHMNRDAHMRGVNNIQSSKFTPLTLTSDVGRIGQSSLWNPGFEVVRDFNEIPYMEFGKTTAMRMVGTKHDSAVIFDTNTGTMIEEFSNADLGNQYPFNKSTFDYRDELVLSDGLLWDVRGKEVVHKLDKFKANENGTFHPNGREIISNSEIWDLRTFKLLRTVVGLESCRLSFNDIGSVLYGAYHTRESNEEKVNCFYTFNADDYSPIATIDVKRPLFQVAVDSNEKYIATIECQFATSGDEFIPPVSGVDCVCRLYEIGRTKEEGDEDGEESDSEEESEDDDDDDDDVVEFDEEIGNGDDNQNDDDDIMFDIGETSLSTISLSTDSSDEDDTLFSLNTSMDD